jgi:multiple sugar transport system substrate-binding protein
MIMGKKRMLFLSAVIVLVLAVGVQAFDLTEFGFKPAGSYDFGGETVTIISWTSERMETLYFQGYLPVLDRVAEAEELFNCKIEFMQTREIPEVNFNRLLSGESVNDLWHVQNKIGYWELVSANALYPVHDLLGDEYYEMLPPSLMAVEEAFKYQGKYWGLGPVEWRPIYGYQNDMKFVAYNKTLIEREGLPDPYELYLAGEWTWDAATDLAVRATQDTDGDGEIDVWGIVGAGATDLAVANGATMTAVDETGRVVFVADDPKYIEALEQTTLWWTELGVQMPTYSSGDLGSAFRNGRAAMNFGISAFNLPELLENMTDEWGLVPFPMGPSTDRHHWTVQALNTTVIPANAADPEALAALRAFLWREEDISINDFLAAHVNSQEAADVLLTANREWEGQASRLFETFLGDFTTYEREVQQGQRSATAAMAEIKPIIQANLDDLFSQ